MDAVKQLGRHFARILDNAYVINGGTAAITLPGAACSCFYLGDPNSTNSGTIQMSGGNLSSAYEYFGNLGSGTFNQSGGTNNVIYGPYLGNNAGSTGSYGLSGSGVLSSQYEYVGFNGTGAFGQSGGTNTPIFELDLGENLGASGSYNLTGSGLLSGAGAENVGYSGTGTFTQSGGTNNLNSFEGSLCLGRTSGSSGSYYLTGSGLLSAPTECAGYYGRGTFTQCGGTNNTTNLYLGQNSGSNGSYNLSGSGVLSARIENVGYFGALPARPIERHRHGYAIGRDEHLHLPLSWQPDGFQRHLQPHRLGVAVRSL